MEKYRCICGYHYESSKGESSSDTDTGIPFEDLLDDWVCPVCKAEKSRFRKVG